jgi:hypothetical protein
MYEGWHVAEMILTVQVAEKMRLAVAGNDQPPPAGQLC